MAEVTIEVRPNGPYIVNGSIELRDANGNVLPTQTRTVLCRCGASTNKPFCDGTHSKVGFQAAARAVPESAESATSPNAGAISATALLNCATRTGTSYQPRPGLCFVAVAHRRTSRSAMVHTQRLAFRLPHERCLSPPKARPARTPGRSLQETSMRRQQRWMRPNPLE